MTGAARAQPARGSHAGRAPLVVGGAVVALLVHRVVDIFIIVPAGRPRGRRLRLPHDALDVLHRLRGAARIVSISGRQRPGSRHGTQGCTQPDCTSRLHTSQCAHPGLVAQRSAAHAAPLLAPGALCAPCFAQTSRHASPRPLGREGGSARACTPALGCGSESFISATPGGKSFKYQGWRWMTGMVTRFVGSGTRIFDSRSRHSRDTLTCAGNSYSTFSILCAPAPARRRAPGHCKHTGQAQERATSHNCLVPAARLNHLLQLLVVVLVLWPLKGVRADQHDVEHDAAAPQVRELRPRRLSSARAQLAGRACAEVRRARRPPCRRTSAPLWS